MKLRHLLPALAFAIPVSMMGAPAYPGVLTHTNPDGTTVEFRLHGDEFFSYRTDVDGTIMLEADAQGRLVPMKRNGVVVSVSQDAIEGLRAEKAAVPTMMRKAAAEPQRIAALTTDGRSTYPTKTTDVHSLVILMEYADTKFTSADPVAAFTDWLNKEGYNENSAVGSARDYYIKASNGQFAPTFDVAGVITLPEKSEYYVDGGRYEKFGEALEYALAEADKSVDFSEYDYDGDGTVDTVYFIYAGYGQADSGLKTTVWPHQSQIQAMCSKTIEYDGVVINPYATSQELKGGTHYYSKDNELAGIGTFCHEFGHVLGLPDLYDPAYGSDSITPDAWSVMDQGSYSGDSNCPPLFSAYERWVCNWLEYSELEDGNRYDLLRLDESNMAYRVNIPRGSSIMKNEYFVVETRHRSGWDTYLPNDGILIWHVNYTPTKWLYNTVNSDKNKPCVHILSSDGTGNPLLKNYGNPSNNATWPNAISGLNYIYPEGEISFEPYVAAGKNTTYMTDIAYDAETMTGSFDYNVITSTPNDVTVLHDAMLLRDEYNRNTGFSLNWDAVEGATGYALTVWRENSSGTKYYINSLNDLNVGNVTTYEVKGLSASMMKATMYVYVRVIKDLPSTEVSNTLTFVPSELSGVESVESVEAPVFGVKGAVVAPANAEVYTLAGVRVANADLAAGLYIVRCNGKSHKVVVK